MNSAKKIGLHLLALLLITWLPFAYAGPGAPFNKIVFFGDSLSDNGNLYSYDAGFLPKSPPYYQGRFSNGPVWSELTARYLSEKYGTSASNYAFGGETAIFHNPFKKYLPRSLSHSVDSYYMRTAWRNRANTLFVIWVGANDYLPEQPAKDGNKEDNDKKDKARVVHLTGEVIENIKTNIQALIGYGGKDILVINIPDLSLLPTAEKEGNGSILSALTATHNELLQKAVQEIAESNKGVNIQIFDVNAIFVSLLTDTASFNNHHQSNFTNTTSACWQGGYRLLKRSVEGEAPISEQQISQELQTNVREQLRANPAKLTNTNRMDVEGIANLIATTPSLKEAYIIGGQVANGQPCSNPSNYVFWDHVHPTAVVHQLLFKELANFIETNYQPK